GDEASRTLRRSPPSNPDPSSFSPSLAPLDHVPTIINQSLCLGLPAWLNGVMWVPTGKTFTSSTTKADYEPPNGSNEDITNPYESDQTLNVSACTLNLSASTPFNPKKERLRVWLLKKLMSKNQVHQGIHKQEQSPNSAQGIIFKCTQMIKKTVMASVDNTSGLASQRKESSGPRLHSMTPATFSSGLVLNPVSQQPCIPPKRDDWDRLFQPMFDEYFNPPSIVVSPVQEAAAPRAVVLAVSSVSTSVDQDAPSTSIPSTQEQEHSLNISQGPSSNVRQTHTLFEHLGKCTKSHPIANVIGDPSYSVSMRKQLQIDAMWCYFDAFLTLVEPKNFKQVMTEPSWIDAMQEEIHEFQRLEVWELVLCPDKVLLIKLKWIYKVKMNEFGRVPRIRRDLLLKDSCKKKESISRNPLHRLLE
ncbi:retrovirus-related pol polyprotein from transposon TNT 1-94, partial [Tanacetum coccineum]